MKDAMPPSTSGSRAGSSRGAEGAAGRPDISDGEAGVRTGIVQGTVRTCSLPTAVGVLGTPRGSAAGDVKRANETVAQATGFRTTPCHSPALGGRSPCSSCDSSAPSPHCTRVRVRVQVRERVRVRVGSPRVGVRARAVALVTPDELPRCAVRTARPRRVCVPRTHRACGLPPCNQAALQPSRPATKPPCASGTYSAHGAGAHHPYVQYGGTGAIASIRVSLGADHMPSPSPNPNPYPNPTPNPNTVSA